MAQDSNSGHHMMLPPAERCPTFAFCTTQDAPATRAAQPSETATVAVGECHCVDTPLSLPIETPTRGRGGGSRITVSPTAQATARARTASTPTTQGRSSSPSIIKDPDTSAGQRETFWVRTTATARTAASVWRLERREGTHMQCSGWATAGDDGGGRMSPNIIIIRCLECFGVTVGAFLTTHSVPTTVSFLESGGGFMSPMSSTS